MCHCATFWSHVVLTFYHISYSDCSKSSLHSSSPQPYTNHSCLRPLNRSSFHPMRCSLSLSLRMQYLLIAFSLRMQYLLRWGFSSMAMTPPFPEHHSINCVPSFTPLVISNPLFHSTLKIYSYFYSCQSFICILISCIWLSVPLLNDTLASKISRYFTSTCSSHLLLVITFTMSV